jgi:hypothetical protein
VQQKLRQHSGRKAVVGNYFDDDDLDEILKDNPQWKGLSREQLAEVVEDEHLSQGNVLGDLTTMGEDADE